MILLTFAHMGEAQHFIRRKHTQPVDFFFDGVYRTDDEMLVITREGLQATTERVSAVCTYFRSRISQVINFGIAGSLDEQLELNQIYGIRYVFLEINGECFERKFKTANSRAKKDCVTASKRVLNDHCAEKLSGFAHIVDRELWAIASVCKLFRIPFQAYKLISDRAGNSTSTAEVKEKSELFSKHLFDFYKKLQLSQK